MNQWPTTITHRIPNIPIYHDGLLCTICDQYICRQIKGLKNHWSAKHGVLLAHYRGRPTPTQRQEMSDIIAQNSHAVSCQRLFV